jgi:hypothetical protein
MMITNPRQLLLHLGKACVRAACFFNTSTLAAFQLPCWAELQAQAASSSSSASHDAALLLLWVLPQLAACSS